MTEYSLFQAICFIAGALVFCCGLFGVFIAPNTTYRGKAIILIGSGILIAMPAVMPMFLGFNFENSDLPEFPLLVLNFIYFAAPICGVIQLVLTLRHIRAIKKNPLIRAQGVSNTVLIKKKNEGLSFFAKDGQILFECTGSNGENVVIIADNNEAAQNLAIDHYQGVDFTIKQMTFNN